MNQKLFVVVCKLYVETKVSHALLVRFYEVLAVLFTLLYDAGVTGFLCLGASATRLQRLLTLLFRWDT